MKVVTWLTARGVRSLEHITIDGQRTICNQGIPSPEESGRRVVDNQDETPKCPACAVEWFRRSLAKPLLQWPRGIFNA